MSTISRFHKEVVIGGVIKSMMNSVTRQPGAASLGAGNARSSSILAKFFKQVFDVVDEYLTSLIGSLFGEEVGG